MVTPRQILFMRTDRLGETLLNLPAVMALRAAYPAARLTMMVHPELKTLLAGTPGIDALVAYRDSKGLPWWLKAIRLARVFRAERYDAAIFSNPKKEFHLAAYLAGLPIRVGYDCKWGCLLSHRVPDRKALGARHEVEYNLELVHALCPPMPAPQWRLPLFERERIDVLQLLAQQGIKPSEPFVVVHPWTSNPRKQWPLDRFRALIRLIRASLPVQVVVAGGPEERAEAAAVLPEGGGVADLVGRVTLRQLAALLECGRLLVSNDSGPVHLATAVGTKTVVLFGTPEAAAGPRRWGPWGEGHQVIWKPSLDAITVEEVFAAVRVQLA